ncbi:DNA-binding transcriptional repressor EbgR [compost metagenome]
MDSLYWGPIFEGISSSLNKKKLNIVTLTEPNDDSMFSLLNPDAIMGIITIGLISTSILFDIKRLNIPVVMVDHVDPNFKSDSIFTDNISAMREIMNALIRKGYKKYQFVGNIKDAHSYYERWLIFSASLLDLAIEHQQIPSLLDHDLNDYANTLKEAFEQNEFPEVFVCANDFYVNYTLEACEYAGIEIPEHCIFTGFDNTYPALPIKATVNIDKELLGKRAVDQILWRILNPHSSYEKKLIQAEIIYRD